MTQMVAEDLTYNETGNQVRFEIHHQLDESNATPSFIENMTPREVEPGEVIFEQDEPADVLYYIAKGRYDVTVDGEKVADLTPHDIFMGEMSFLLHSNRAATVTARTQGRLIEVSRQRFVEAIRNQPHYALLMGRLLAQRVRTLIRGNEELHDAAGKASRTVEPSPVSE